MSRRIRTFTLGIAATTATALSVALAAPSEAVTIPPRHTITCDSASFYAHYSHDTGPFDLIRVLYKGDGIGHDPAEQEINGWAYSQDFGPNDWGFVQMACFD